MTPSFPPRNRAEAREVGGEACLVRRLLLQEALPLQADDVGDVVPQLRPSISLIQPSGKKQISSNDT